jgi:hypothetical protein
MDVRLMPSPKTISPGCGICLRVQSDDIGKVRLLLGESFRSICFEDEDGISSGKKGHAPWAP